MLEYKPYIKGGINMEKTKLIINGTELLDKTIIYIGCDYIKLNDGRVLYLDNIELEEVEI